MISHRILSEIPEARVQWPTPQDMEKFATLIRRREPLITQCIGFIDGIHISIQNSSDHKSQNSNYNGWLAGVTISCVFLFVPTGKISWAAVNFPGSYHDASVAHGLIERLLNHNLTPEPYFVAADSAFPHSGPLASKIKTPLTKRTESEASRAAQQYSAALVSIRQCAEWGMRGLRSKFPRLQVPLTSNDAHRLEIIKTAVFLYNLKVTYVGLSQIHSVLFDD